MVSWVMRGHGSLEVSQKVASVGIKISEDDDYFLISHIFPLQSEIESYHCVSKIRKSDILDIRPIEVRWDVLSDLQGSRKMSGRPTISEN